MLGLTLEVFLVCHSVIGFVFAIIVRHFNVVLHILPMSMSVIVVSSIFFFV